MFFTILGVLAPVFITVAIGYAWSRSGNSFDSGFVSKLVINVFAPVLIFHSLSTSHLALERVLAAGGIIILCLLLSGLAGFVLLRVLKQPLRVYLPAIMFPNLGNIGTPVAYFALGQEGLIYAVAVFAAMALSNWTLGLWISSGELSPKKALTTPPIIAAALALVFIGFGIEAPGWINRTLQLISGATFPLMLLLLGTSLATMKLSNARLSFGLGAFRIVGGFAIGLGVSELLGLEGALRGVIILMSGMPSAVFNVLFAQVYNRRPEEVAGVIFASTLMTAFSLPLIVGYVLATT